MNAVIADSPATSFSELLLPEPLKRALQSLGYEAPSPIQAATIPTLLEGRDVLGQAQTGTGKTAAFALPMLARIDLSRPVTQGLVLAPTRELGIQVAEAFQRYAEFLPGFHVLPIYGGQSYDPQLRGLKRGAHVVVGTPGRIVDHLKRGSLKLDQLSMLVLDEADEMLRMGFVEDIEWILDQAPADRQTALFSATMPPPIRSIAQKHLRNASEVTIASKTRTNANIRQRYWAVSGGINKIEALTRILEAEPFEAMIVFARTKLATEDLATRLEARGFSAAALNGDLQQSARERIVNRLREGSLDIVIATDIAARGLDVERITHVVNYDVPTDPESYVHRIGRTGRAGRTGEAILFITPRERHLLRIIERATRQPVEPMSLPTVTDVNSRRVERFTTRLEQALQLPQLDEYRALVQQFAQAQNVPLEDIAAALIGVAHGPTPLLLGPEDELIENAPRAPRAGRDRDREGQPRRSGREGGGERSNQGFETWRVEVGHRHGVKPGQLVGAISNEGGLEGRLIGKISIREDYSLIDLPPDMPSETRRTLEKAWVAGQQLRIKPVDGGHYSADRPSRGKPPRQKR